MAWRTIFLPVKKTQICAGPKYVPRVTESKGWSVASQNAPPNYFIDFFVTRGRRKFAWGQNSPRQRGREWPIFSAFKQKVSLELKGNFPEASDFLMFLDRNKLLPPASVGYAAQWTRNTFPCCVTPTGANKTAIFRWAITSSGRETLQSSVFSAFRPKTKNIFVFWEQILRSQNFFFPYPSRRKQKISFVLWEQIRRSRNFVVLWCVQSYGPARNRSCGKLACQRTRKHQIVTFAVSGKVTIFPWAANGFFSFCLVAPPLFRGTAETLFGRTWTPVWRRWKRSARFSLSTGTSFRYLLGRTSGLILVLKGWLNANFILIGLLRMF